MCMLNGPFAYAGPPLLYALTGKPACAALTADGYLVCCSSPTYSIAVKCDAPAKREQRGAGDREQGGRGLHHASRTWASSVSAQIVRVRAMHLPAARFCSDVHGQTSDGHTYFGLLPFIPLPVHRLSARFFGHGRGEHVIRLALPRHHRYKRFQTT